MAVPADASPTTPTGSPASWRCASATPSGTPGCWSSAASCWPWSLGVRAALRAASGTVRRGHRRRAAPARRVPTERQRGRQGRRVAHAGVLRRPVHHGRRAGQHRRRSPASPTRPRTPWRASCGATMVLLWASAVLSAIVDNIPYVATMSPIVADLVDANGGSAAQGAVVVARARRRPRRQRHRGRCVGQRRHSRAWPSGPVRRSRSGSSPSTGSSSPSITVALCVPYLWLRYFAFA